MTRYCVEIDASFSKVVVHQQCCTVYHEAHLVAASLASDLGEYPSSGAALRKAQADFPAVRLCDSCCRSKAQHHRPQASGSGMLRPRQSEAHLYYKSTR